MGFNVPAPGALIVPLGSQVTAVRSVTGAVVAVTLDVADYDYEPFEDPTAPAFEFVADVIRVDVDHIATIDRAVTCISRPGRISQEKDT